MNKQTWLTKAIFHTWDTHTCILKGLWNISQQFFLRLDKPVKTTQTEVSIDTPPIRLPSGPSSSKNSIPINKMANKEACSLIFHVPLRKKWWLDNNMFGTRVQMFHEGFRLVNARNINCRQLLLEWPVYAGPIRSLPNLPETVETILIIPANFLPYKSKLQSPNINGIELLQQQTLNSFSTTARDPCHPLAHTYIKNLSSETVVENAGY